MDIDKLIPQKWYNQLCRGFGSLMDIDKLIRKCPPRHAQSRFGSLMDIDKLIHKICRQWRYGVLVL